MSITVVEALKEIEEGAAKVLEYNREFEEKELYQSSLVLLIQNLRSLHGALQNIPMDVANRTDLIQNVALIHGELTSTAVFSGLERIRPLHNTVKKWHELKEIHIEWSWGA
jgi:hypothetical protein